MTIESMIKARLAALHAARAAVDFEDVSAPIATAAQDAQQGQGDELAAHEMHLGTASIPTAVSAQDDDILPADWQLPPKAVKRRKGKGSK
jgi:hypothetical protein